MKKIFIIFLFTIFFGLLTPPQNVTAYENTCKKSNPKSGITQCVNTGKTFSGKCQVIVCNNCSKDGNPNDCTVNDDYASKQIVDCNQAEAKLGGYCGQIDYVDPGGKICKAGSGYCDYIKVQCYDRCQLPTKPPTSTPRPTITPVPVINCSSLEILVNGGQVGTAYRYKVGDKVSFKAIGTASGTTVKNIYFALYLNGASNPVFQQTVPAVKSSGRYTATSSVYKIAESGSYKIDAKMLR